MTEKDLVKAVLQRDELHFNTEPLNAFFTDKNVLVTGGGGSIGSELCRLLASLEIKSLIILDFYENNAYYIEQELKQKYPDLSLKVEIANVREYDKINKVFSKYNIDVVFHAAAHKHVPLMENAPDEAIKNNVLGTLNVAKCADKFGVKSFIFISTDKAVEPSSVMGATKLLGEKIVKSYSKRSKSKFIAVRFGNVLNSNGSVIPLFKKQILSGGPITVTDKEVERYFMTIKEAVYLILTACSFDETGNLYVLDMGKPIKIYDLAVNMIKFYGYKPDKDVKIKIVGLRPGEKLYETVFYDEETVIKTKDKKINVVAIKDFDVEKLSEAIDGLIDSALNSRDTVKDELFSIVKEFN